MSTTSYQSTNQLNYGGTGGTIGRNTTTPIASFKVNQPSLITQMQIFAYWSGNNPGTVTWYLFRTTDWAIIASGSITMQPSNYYVYNIPMNVVINDTTTEYQLSLFYSDQTGGVDVEYGGSSTGNSNGITWNISDNVPAVPFEVSITWQPPNNPPNPPAWNWNQPNASGSTINKTPKFFFNVSDPDSGNTITNVEVQCSSSSSFGSNYWDVQYGTDSGYGLNVAGFSGLPTPNNGSNLVIFNAAAEVNPLSIGTWYMRVRCKDNNGAWSNWSPTLQFNIVAPPWNDTPNGPGQKAQWMNDLATVINNGMSFRGWAQCPLPTVDTTWDIIPWNIAVRRCLLNTLSNNVGFTNLWTNSVLNTLTTADQVTGGWFSGTANDVAFYSQNGCTSGRTTSGQFFGTGCFYITSTYSGSQYICIYTFPNPVPVSAGTYSQEVWFKAPAGRTVRLTNYLDSAKGTRASGSPTATGSGITVTATGNWQRITNVVTVPSGYPYMEQELAILNAANGDTLYVNSFMCYAGNVFAQDRQAADIIDLRNACASI
ncbi:MAG: hypothetical protein K6T83_03265 [Alicyclobacillus sp.]|nr:hypothetical protein [Alicyclobacillus sp.]